MGRIDEHVDVIIDRPGLPDACGKLAWDSCHKALPLAPIRLNSFTPYYIGTFDSQDGLCSLESVETYPTLESAALALATGAWTQRSRP